MGGGGGDGGDGGLWLHGLLQGQPPQLTSELGEPGTDPSWSFLGFNPFIGAAMARITRKKIASNGDIFYVGNRNLLNPLLRLSIYFC